MANTKTVYENTPANAASVGWGYSPEYCFGNPAAAFVTHDHRAGTFTFFGAPEFDRMADDQMEAR